MTREPSGPVARVRARVAMTAGSAAARSIPDHYHRLGRVVVVRLPADLRPHFRAVGEAWLAEAGVATVLHRSGPTAGDWRLPHVERLAGEGSETEVVEHGIRYRFDASQILFARGNHTERRRAGVLTRPGETVIDLFAGIGYFTLPAAVIGRAGRVHACEENPRAVAYLQANIKRNHAENIVEVHPGDNRRAALPRGEADRVFLGLLPTSLPWLPYALPLLRASGGTLHVHTVVGTRAGEADAMSEIASAVAAAGFQLARIAAREVKAYGPGRRHVVLDATVAAP
ncbi:MAG: methyltransferase [Thermoplasmata archaeon]|nr:methyltransferase [Thermoplasmata archaeon]